METCGVPRSSWGYQNMSSMFKVYVLCLMNWRSGPRPTVSNSCALGYQKPYGTLCMFIGSWPSHLPANSGESQCSLEAASLQDPREQIQEVRSSGCLQLARDVKSWVCETELNTIGHRPSQHALCLIVFELLFRGLGWRRMKGGSAH